MEVVTFGETMVLFTPIENIPIEYVHQFSKKIAGAESNCAIGLRRLGHSVGWFSKLGNDPFGRYVHNFIRGEGIDTSRCSFTDDSNTGVFFKEKRSESNIHLYYYRKNSAASQMKADEIDEEYISSAKILHLTGITPALSSSCLETVYKAIEVAKKYNVKIFFDPNIRLKLWKEEEIKRVLLHIAGQVDYFLPGLDEGSLLSGHETPEEIANFFIEKGASNVVIKLGSKGAYFQTDNKKGYVKGFPVNVVIDPVGAGDGFAAGLISGMLRSEPIETAVKRGNAVGALVVQVNGDIEGLPNNKEVDCLLNGMQDYQDVKR